jgi:hypothetical protein
MKLLKVIRCLVLFIRISSTQDSHPSSDSFLFQAPLEYMLINGAAVLLSGILLAQVSFISDRWLLYASLPILFLGIVILVLDQKTRKTTPLHFLNASGKSVKYRPWIDLLPLLIHNSTNG